MADERDSFALLLDAARGGDEAAAAALVTRYEAEIRRAVRMRLTDPTLAPVLDSVDICQSILGRFFVRLREGHLDAFDTPEKVIALMVTMAQQRVVDHARMQRAARRDRNRLQPMVGADGRQVDVDAGTPTPSRVISGREQLDRLRDHLGEELYQVAVARAEGRSWDDLAAELGVRPDALRKRLARALERLAGE